MHTAETITVQSSIPTLFTNTFLTYSRKATLIHEVTSTIIAMIATACA